MSFVKGMRTGLYVSEPTPAGDAGATASIQFHVRAYRAAGSTTLPVRLRSGQGLDMFRLAGGSIITVATVAFQVLADAEVPVSETAELEVSALPISLSNGSILWAERQPLHRVQGTSDTDLEIRVTTQDANSAITGSAWAAPFVTGRSWRLPRRGRFRPTDPAFRAVRRAALEDDLQVFVRRVLPDEKGAPAQTEGGMAIITSFNTPAPADGMVDATWVFEGVGPLESDGRIQPDLSGVMLDFRLSANAINLGFM